MRRPFSVRGRLVGATVGLLAVILLPGCARSPDARPDTQAALPAPASAIPPAGDASARAPTTPAAAAPPAQVAASRPKPGPPERAAQTAAPTTTPPAATAKPTPTPQTTTQQSAKAAPKTEATKPAPLNLASLEQRIRETKAIGTLTKITLKNQVDDLLDQFRRYYQGKLETDLAALRRSYDLLLLKFVSLLQDDDPPLATAIVASREAIWGLLADRTRFATL